MMGGLFMLRLNLPLAHSDAEAPQPLDIVGGVVAPPALITPGERQRSEPLAEPEPAWGYTEFLGGFTDGECASLREHGHTIKLTYRFI
jgi:hypothetical protein